MHYIYKFTNIKNNMIYVGETTSFKIRTSAHRRAMIAPNYTGKHSLFVVEHFKKFSPDDFEFEILHTFNKLSDAHVLLVEADYIDSQNALYPNGYNCRKYSKSGWLYSETYYKDYGPDKSGLNNGNYGNKWSDELKAHLSVIKIKQHANGESYDHTWKEKIGKASSENWASYSEDKVDEIMSKQSLSSSKYYYLQKTKDGEVIKRWETMREILKANPDYRRQGIYSNVNGYKGSHRGFVWEKVKR